MRRSVSILLIGLIVAITAFFSFYFQSVVKVTENTNAASRTIVIDDSVVESLLTLRSSDTRADIEADLTATDFRDLEDASSIEKLFTMREH